MDNTTHEMRLAGWKKIIDNCQARPEGQTVKQWLAEQGIQEKIIITGCGRYGRRLMNL